MPTQRTPEDEAAPIGERPLKAEEMVTWKDSAGRVFLGIRVDGRLRGVEVE